MIVLGFIVSAVITDFKGYRISNRMILTGLILGIMLRVFGEGSMGVVHYLFNISLPVILLFFLYLLRGIGAGDIKLFSVIGGFVATKLLMATLAGSFLMGACIGAGKLLYQLVKMKSLKKEKTRIHFSLCILLGYLGVIFCQNCAWLSMTT